MFKRRDWRHIHHADSSGSSSDVSSSSDASSADEGGSAGCRMLQESHLVSQEHSLSGWLPNLQFLHLKTPQET